MLKVYVYLHVIIFSIYLLKPILPFIDYQVNKKYIAEKLCENRDKPICCCNGKCYLNKQLAKQSENTDTPNRNDNRKSQNNEVKEFLNIPASLPEPGILVISVSFHFEITYSILHIPVVYSPPWLTV